MTSPTVINLGQLLNSLDIFVYGFFFKKIFNTFSYSAKADNVSLFAWIQMVDFRVFLQLLPTGLQEIN